MKTKICTKCKIRKNLNDFCKSATGKHGVQSVCTACNKEYRLVNKENRDAYQKTFYLKNKRKINAYGKTYYQENKDELSAKKKIYRKTNKEVLASYGKKYRLLNKDKINTRQRNRRKINDKVRLNSNMTRGINRSLKGAKNNYHWEDLVGYTIDALRTHIEKQFTKGMSWENYGDWHLDHRTPISAHNFTQPTHEDFKKCWALKNLQPLWALDNLSKGAKLTKHFQPSLQL